MSIHNLDLTNYHGLQLKIVGMFKEKGVYIYLTTFFEAGSCYITQAGITLMIFLSQSPSAGITRHVPQ
jgi:hypothetical protein